MTQGAHAIIDAMRYVLLFALVGCTAPNPLYEITRGDAGGSASDMARPQIDGQGSRDLAETASGDLAGAVDLALTHDDLTSGDLSPPCGMHAQECCPPAVVGTACGETNTVCVSDPAEPSGGRCIYCGGTGQLCCPGNKCLLPTLMCQPPGSANAGKCE